MSTMTAAVDVDVDPMTAFTAFTDEYDEWWGNVDGAHGTAVVSPAPRAAGGGPLAARRRATQRGASLRDACGHRPLAR
jgi:hypothetical protein